MESCTEQMLKMEQPDGLYPLGRSLREAFHAGVVEESGSDERLLPARMEIAEPPPK